MDATFAALGGVAAGAALAWALLRGRIAQAVEQGKATVAAELAQAKERTRSLEEERARRDAAAEAERVELDGSRGELESAKERLARAEERAAQLPKLEEELTEATRELDAMRAQVSDLRASSERLTAELEAERDHSKEKLELLESAREALSNQFKALANQNPRGEEPEVHRAEQAEPRSAPGAAQGPAHRVQGQGRGGHASGDGGCFWWRRGRRIVLADSAVEEDTLGRRVETHVAVKRIDQAIPTTRGSSRPSRCGWRSRPNGASAQPRDARNQLAHQRRSRVQGAALPRPGQRGPEQLREQGTRGSGVRNVSRSGAQWECASFTTKLLPTSPSLAGLEQFAARDGPTSPGSRSAKTIFQQIGLNIMGMSGCINHRLGVRRADDTLPDRWFRRADRRQRYKGERIRAGPSSTRC